MRMGNHSIIHPHLHLERNFDMKKILLITFLLFSLVGCGKDDTSETVHESIQAIQPTESQINSTEPEKETAAALEIETAGDPSSIEEILGDEPVVIINTSESSESASENDSIANSDSETDLEVEIITDADITENKEVQIESDSLSDSIIPDSIMEELQNKYRQEAQSEINNPEIRAQLEALLQ